MEQSRRDDAAPAPRLRWYARRPAIILALVLFYPVGLVLLMNSSRLRTWEKALGAAGLLPVFLLAMLGLLIPYWDFGGGMELSGFQLDFTKGWQQYRKVERHRQAQRDEAAAVTPSEQFVHLSWPDFRGPRRDGIVTDSNISLDWEKSPPRERWRQPVGEGYAGFVVGHGCAYTIEQRRDKEAVTCYDIATGRELWVHAYEASFEEKLGGNGPRATPTLRGDRLYALGAEGHLNCLDARTGRRIWGHNVLIDFDADNLNWGMSGSPLVVDGKIVVTNSGLGSDSIIAFDAGTGELIWRTDAGQQAYSSLVLATVAGRRQILNLAAFNLNGIDPDTGRVLWSFPWATDYGINVAQPLLVGNDRIFLSSGYGHGCGLIQLEPADGKLEPRQRWANIKMKNKFTTSVLHDGFIYGLDQRVLACLDVETGERKWKGGRYDYGSILLVGEHLLVLAERGRLALVKADPQRFQERGRRRILDGRSWNNPALVGGLLLARNHKEMVCYDLRPNVH